MGDIAIRVEDLGKQYRIGGQQARYKTIRESLVEAAHAPFRRLSSVIRGQSSAVSDATIWALKDVSFEVKRGEAVGIIGRNGAGKSTLLKILTRITEPTEGRAELYGRVGSLLEVGTGFHPELTGRENIYLNGAVLGMKRTDVERKFDEIVDFSGVERFIDTPVKHYSSGMYVRLAFAVAAHMETEILLVDEVLAVGDAAFQKKCLGKMGEVTKGGRTVLFVSHDMGAVLNLCPRAVLLESGRAAESGNTHKVVEHYLREGVKSSGRIVIPASEGGKTDEFRFCSVSVLRPGDGHTGRVSLTEGLDVQLEYRINQPIQGANIVCHLWNNLGICILSSTDVDQCPSSIANVRMPGYYLARCRIPRQYLRPGRYCIGVSASIPGVHALADLPRILAFDVMDTGSVESMIGQQRQGAISPILAWVTEQVAYGLQTDQG
jgi:homopolymeric O-antigen transport system ATP-binding protein